SGVISISRTSDGVMWFGTHTGGFSRYDPTTFTRFTSADGLLANANNASFVAADGSLWFGTGDGVRPGGASRYDGTRFITFNATDNVVEFTTITQTGDGTLWFGGGEGVYPRISEALYRFDGARLVKIETSGASPRWITTLASDATGTL